MSIEIPLHLPEVDKKYTLMHMADKPFTILPGEVLKEYMDKQGRQYIITNYCRLWSMRYNKFINSISGVNIKKVVLDLFTTEELDNEYSEANINMNYNKALYQRDRLTKIAKQTEYNNKRKAEKQQYDKAYRIISKGGSILPL